MEAHSKKKIKKKDYYVNAISQKTPYLLWHLFILQRTS